jgi:hypothetical protein
MAMRPQLWNAHALAVEFGLGYRVAAARLVHVPVAEVRGSQNLYLMKDAAPALIGHAAPAAAPGRRVVDPKWREMLGAIGAPFSVSQNPVDEAICLTCLEFAEKFPWRIGTLAVGAGVSAAAAYTIWSYAAVALPMMVDDLTEQCGIRWRRDDHFLTPLEPDWRKLAEAAGEPYDLAGWKAYRGEHARCA